MNQCTRALACAVALFASVSPALGQAGSTPATAIPVTQESRHRVVYENPLVRVLEVRVPPGDTALWHVHADRHVGVVIEAARAWTQVPGSVSTWDPRKVGDIIENWKSTLPYTHRVGNADTVAFRYVIGQLVRTSGIDANALPTSATLRLESENDRARVYRVTLAPGQTTGFHDHAQPGLTIQVTPGALQIEGAPAQATSAGTGAGAWWWRRAGQGHALRNAGTTTIQLIEIDWR